MGKKISVYWSTILVTIPIILAVFFVMIFITYNYVYNITYNNSIDHIKKAAELTDEVLADYDLHDKADAEEAEKILDSVCEQFDVAYVYVLQINKDTGTQKYLTLGTGEDASENFKQERYIGYVFNDEPNEYELSALEGKTDNNIEHLINQFGDTICYNLGRTSKNAEDEIICSEIDLTSFTKSLRLDFMRSATIPVLLVVFISILFSIVLHFKVSKPARIISNKMTGFIQEHEERFKPLEINASKEFHDIAESYNKMASDIDRYLVDLSELNRQKAELNIARNIQMGLLEPADYSDSSYRIKAYMLPAKDVGGDLYEYQLLPDGKMCVVIADVSDKGISAALFMSRAITMIHQYASAGMSPGRVLYEYNKQLAARNPNMLFITTFIGILDADTCTLVYANAGHNTPYIISDKLIKLDGEHGSAAGIFPDSIYPEHTVPMKPGDLLFMYTDGVTEARNSKRELFGEEALEDELSKQIGLAEKAVLPCVMERLNEFMKGAERADDITMLTLRLNHPFHKKLSLEAKCENLSVINETIKQMDVDEDTRHLVRFICEEIFVNICSYAYPGGTGKADVIIECDRQKVTLTFIDSGIRFDPTKDIVDIETYDTKTAIGGLGRFLSFSYADEYNYHREADRNVLTVIKKLPIA
nr:SpoIIE family protein phosphatase [uncultured Ruminococcus sp.]